MIFPSIEEYKDALRIAGHSLKTLQEYEPVLRDDGDLWFSSGNFAVVFKMQHRSSGHLLALKCFTRHQENRAESYRLITECLKDYPNDYLVRYEYYDEELWVNSRAAGDRDFPVLAMDWAEGATLGEYVRDCCTYNNREALQNLIEEFNWFAFWLLSQPFAHGDLKPDNIVVRPNGKPVLLDYDGMYVPSMKGQVARELGSTVYRHPKRSVDTFGKGIDDFALFVLSLEMMIIAKSKDLYRVHLKSDSLFFDEETLYKQQLVFSWAFVDKNIKLFSEIITISMSSDDINILDAINQFRKICKRIENKKLILKILYPLVYVIYHVTNPIVILITWIILFIGAIFPLLPFLLGFVMEYFIDGAFWPVTIVGYLVIYLFKKE